VLYHLPINKHQILQLYREYYSIYRKNNIVITKTTLSKALNMHLNMLSKYYQILEKLNVILKKKKTIQNYFHK
jgi:hypothetical protein